MSTLRMHFALVLAGFVNADWDGPGFVSANDVTGNR